MKRILITGANSYIGTSFEKWVEQWPEEYQVDTVGTRNGEWKEFDFFSYDAVFHVAGIAHIKETRANKDLYYKVNRDLAYEIAKKAKESKVKHFVFLSSMSVYGIDIGVINKETPLNPNSAYGKSKMEAEELIRRMQDNVFHVAIIRPPMVYGKGCKGNYQRLAKLALNTPIFPKIDNSRSMIYIDNLSEFVKLLVDNHMGGLFFPQNIEYVNTGELVRLISEIHGKKIILTPLFNPVIKLVNTSTTRKLFGNLSYDFYKANIDEKAYNLYSFQETIKLTHSLEE